MKVGSMGDSAVGLASGILFVVESEVSVGGDEGGFLLRNHSLQKLERKKEGVMLMAMKQKVMVVKNK